MPRSRAAAAAAAPVGRPVGRALDGHVHERRDLLERAQLARPARAARARTRGRSRTALAIAPSSVPWSSSSSAAVFSPIPLRARDPVGRVAAQRDEVGHRAPARCRSACALSRGSITSGPSCRPRQSTATPLADALEHVAVAGEQERRPPASTSTARERARAGRRPRACRASRESSRTRRRTPARRELAARARRASAGGRRGRRGSSSTR